jgi:Universal stress protein family
MTIGLSVCRDNRNGRRWEHIIFASEFTPESLRAQPHAISFAQENDARLILVHVLEVWGQRIERKRQGLTVAEAMHQLHEIVPPEAGHWCRPETVVEHGEPAERILEVAKQGSADLIVLGLGDASHVLADSHLERSMTHRIQAHASCPAPTVRG